MVVEFIGIAVMVYWLIVFLSTTQWSTNGVNGILSNSNFVNNSAANYGGGIAWYATNGIINDSNLPNKTINKNFKQVLINNSNERKNIINN